MCTCYLCSCRVLLAYVDNCGSHSEVLGTGNCHSGSLSLLLCSLFGTVIGRLRITQHVLIWEMAAYWRPFGNPHWTLFEGKRKEATCSPWATRLSWTSGCFQASLVLLLFLLYAISYLESHFGMGKRRCRKNIMEGGISSMCIKENMAAHLPCNWYTMKTFGMKNNPQVA